MWIREAQQSDEAEIFRLHQESGRTCRARVMGDAGPLGCAVAQAACWVVEHQGRLRAAVRTIPVREINWLGDGPFTAVAERQIAVKIRSTRPPRPAILRPLSPTTATVELLDPEDGVSPGQACVFYAPDSSRILGGGWIWRGE